MIIFNWLKKNLRRHTSASQQTPYPTDATSKVVKIKLGIVKNIWIGAGLLMITLPLHWVLFLVLLTTFLSFMILDETP